MLLDTHTWEGQRGVSAIHIIMVSERIALIFGLMGTAMMMKLLGPLYSRLHHDTHHDHQVSCLETSLFGDRPVLKKKITRFYQLPPALLLSSSMNLWLYSSSIYCRSLYTSILWELEFVVFLFSVPSRGWSLWDFLRCPLYCNHNFCKWKFTSKNTMGEKCTYCPCGFW